MENAQENSPSSDFVALSLTHALTSRSEHLHQTAQATPGVLNLPDAHSLSNLGHGSAQHKTNSGGRFINIRLNACGFKMPCTVAYTCTKAFSTLTQSI